MMNGDVFLGIWSLLRGKKVGVGEHHWYKNSSLLAVVGTGECVIIVGQFFKLAWKTLRGSEALMKGLKKSWWFWPN